MAKIKFLILFLCVAACLTACKKNHLDEDFDVQGQFTKDTIALRAYAVKNNIPVIKDPQYNIFYQIIAPGTGEAVTSFDSVSVKYSVRFLDGKEFIAGTTELSPLAQFIPGWEAGIPLIKKGGTIRLLLPSFYAYGNQGTQTIPPNAPLDFILELIDVKK